LSHRKKRWAGGAAIETKYGNFYAPNITKDKETGIGDWTDADFIRALRHGISPIGRNYFPAFPYSSYSKLSDADMLAIKEYIFSLPAIKKESKRHEIKKPFNVRELVYAWKAVNFQPVARYTEDNMKKARGPYQFVRGKDKDWDWNRGAYLVEGAMHCTACHTPRDNLGNFKYNLWMSGSLISGGKKGAPNITQSKKFGVGEWTASDWETFLADGVSPNGSAVGGKMGKVIEEGTSKLSRNDMRAVIKYLMSLRAVEYSEVVKKD
jgi:mono/diheme cytochrome c family protein